MVGCGRGCQGAASGWLGVGEGVKERLVDGWVWERVSRSG